MQRLGTMSVLAYSDGSPSQSNCEMVLIHSVISFNE
jgi:hypothetical protein